MVEPKGDDEVSRSLTGGYASWSGFSTSRFLCPKFRSGAKLMRYSLLSLTVSFSTNATTFEGFLPAVSRVKTNVSRGLKRLCNKARSARKYGNAERANVERELQRKRETQIRSDLSSKTTTKGSPLRSVLAEPSRYLKARVIQRLARKRQQRGSEVLTLKSSRASRTRCGSGLQRPTTPRRKAE